MDEAQLYALIDRSNQLAEELEGTAERSSARTDFYRAAGTYRQVAVNAAIAIELGRLNLAADRGAFKP